MGKKRQHRGYSLMETLLAVGTLAVGMLFIAGTFLAGIHLTTISTERTTAAVAAEEAFAKIRLYRIDPDNLSTDRQTSFETLKSINAYEFAYPSTHMDLSQKQYYWSALCRRMDLNSATRLVQVTVFISRRVGSPASYRGGVGRPIPMPVAVSQPNTIRKDEIFINNYDERIFINDGCVIVDNETGGIYRVLNRYAQDNLTTAENEEQMVLLDRPWQGSNLPVQVWVVPPPVGGGRNPCIAVYQRAIRF